MYQNLSENEIDVYLYLQALVFVPFLLAGGTQHWLTQRTASRIVWSEHLLFLSSDTVSRVVAFSEAAVSRKPQKYSLCLSNLWCMDWKVCTLRKSLAPWEGGGGCFWWSSCAWCCLCSLASLRWGALRRTHKPLLGQSWWGAGNVLGQESWQVSEVLG